MLAWLLAALTACAADPADEALAAGMAAQKDGDVEVATAAYERCLALDPERVACHWELGWSHWTRSDWAAVVATWETVERLDPAWPELDRWLPQARQHAAAMAELEAMAAKGPKTATAATAEGRTLRIRAVGDVMLGTDFPTPRLPPEDGATILAGVAPLLRDADLTFANLEGPLCDGGTTRKCKPDSDICYAFRTPTRYARHLVDAGIDVVSTANNHAGDFGSTCRDQTHATLDAAGIAWSGPPETVATVQVDGLSVGLVAFHTSPSGNHLNNPETVDRMVTAAAAAHDLVIVSFHGGAEGASALHVPRGREEFHGEDRGDLRAFARRAIAAGADLVLGHGPHVPRGLEVVDDRLVAYSLGNFATYGRFNLSGHLGTSLVLEVTLDAEGRFVSGRILPVRQPGRGIPQVDEEGRAIALLRQLSAEDFGDTAPTIGQDGTIAPP